MEIAKILSILVILVCFLISLKNKNSRTQKASVTNSSSPSSISDFDVQFNFNEFLLLSMGEDEGKSKTGRSLEYDFYRESCPDAERIVRVVAKNLYKSKPSLAPALLRLVFHDCFIQGCDASVLLDGFEGNKSEKNSAPNLSLKGFDVIDIIKSKVEQVCPGVVSCADILVLAAREAVVVAGGPFYPLSTGRRDSSVSFPDIATNQLPRPTFNLSKILMSFASKGFDVRETVSLLGSHSIGVIHCGFFKDRLTNFSGTGRPDPTVDAEFLNLMRSKCSVSLPTKPPEQAPSYDHLIPSSAPPPFSFYFSLSSSSPAPSPPVDKFLSALPESQGMSMAYQEPGVDFGLAYYRSLLQGKGILYADQQLTAGKETGLWVRAYALDASLFQRDFALAMMKLSNLHVLTAPRGQIRLNCSKAT